MQVTATVGWAFYAKTGRARYYAVVISLSAGPRTGRSAFIAHWAGFRWARPDFKQDPGLRLVLGFVEVRIS